MLLLALLLIATPCAWGHAKLSSPLPWALEEGTEQPCAGATYANHSLPYAQWVIGTNASIGWIIADTDGYGPVTLTFETVPSNFFSNPSTLVRVPLPNVTYQVQDYVLNFIVPNLVCQGPNNTCIVQALESPDNWTDCTTVRVVVSGTNQLLSPYGGNANCEQAYPLQCPGAQYQKVLIPAGYTLGDLATAVAASYALINDSYHVKTPNTPGCSSALLAFLCGKWFQACNDPGSCHDTCTQAVCLCGVQNTQDSGDDWDCNLTTFGSQLTDFGGPCDEVYSPTKQCDPFTTNGALSNVLPCFSLIFALLAVILFN